MSQDPGSRSGRPPQQPAPAVKTSDGAPSEPRRFNGFSEITSFIWGDAQRKHRTSKAEARRLSGEGESIKAIARAIGRDPETVEKWLGRKT